MEPCVGAEAGKRGRCSAASVDIGGGSWYLSSVQTIESPVGKGLFAKPRASFSAAWSPPYLLLQLNYSVTG